MSHTSSTADASLDALLNRTLARARELRRLPESTYRVQFHKEFTFRDAAALVPYLAELGITHLYASPYLAARPGSTHGYDVIDHCRLNPELGAPEDFDALLATLTEHGLTHVLDTVPNHAGVSTNDNVWWNDALENGPGSRYGNFFDIAWNGSPRPELQGKVLIPTLGAPYGDVLEKGELKLDFDAAAGKFFVSYYDRRFPIAPTTYRDILGEEHDLADLSSLNDAARQEVERRVAAFNGTPGDAASFDRLDALLERQHYRLAYWRTAPDEINYRRFFDINDLAALRMERLDVFEAAHSFILPLVAQGKIAGLRIDHPDGLYDPDEYFLRLQQHYLLAVAREVAATDKDLGDMPWEQLRPRLLERLEQEVPAAGEGPLRWPLYVLAEKILAVGESLPPQWALHGTSGYEFLNMANGLFIDARAEAPLTDFYTGWIGDDTPFDEIAYRKKKRILETSLASELHMLAHTLDRLAQRDRHSRDFTLGGLVTALREVIACFSVYRSYITDEGVSETDRARIESAVDEAMRRNPRIDPIVFTFIRDTLLLRFGERFTADDRADQRHFAGKFQQLTAPATAKGIEDTAFYVYNRLLALNEVGGEPSHFGVAPDELHQFFADRQRQWPYAMSTLSTHDTKRSEDVRARLNVLSELPDEWQHHVEQWGQLNAPHRGQVNGRTVPDRNEEYAIYQTLIGAWPLEPHATGEFEVFIERVQAYMQKAMREAKTHTTWTEPDEAYESAVQAFIAAILDKSKAAEFLQSFRPFQQRISHLGLFNSLSQTLLKLTAPGVPDTYQGMELWDFSLVDPDNRRPVDYDRRRQALGEMRSLMDASADGAAGARQLLDTLHDGRAKLLVHWLALTARREHPGLFTTGEYLPLEVVGSRSEHLFAFARRHEDQVAIVALPRRVAGLVASPEGLPLGQESWHDTHVRLPEELRGRSVRNVFTGGNLQGPDLKAAELFASFPVALLM